MDKNKVKKFAFELRNKLFAHTEREETAYTWFKYFTALYFMESNNYLNTGETYLDAVNTPGLSRSGLKEIFIHRCHKLHRLLPGVFPAGEKTALSLFPEALLEPGSSLLQAAARIPHRDWREVEIVGWLYQFYVTEKQKQIVGINKGAIKKEDLPAATQLFTPHWIVKYMVENSLGRLWLQSHPDRSLKTQWQYLFEPFACDNGGGVISVTSPEEIRVLDPACGAGHILVYTFDVLFDIYRAAGYFRSEIPKLILGKNLYGLEIDERAAELTRFALMLKARQRHPRIFNQPLELNIYSFKETNNITDPEVELFAGAKRGGKFSRARQLIDTFKNAKNYGSMVDVTGLDLEFLIKRLAALKKTGISGDIIGKFEPVIRQACLMARRYHVVVTNPPYLSRKAMNAELKQFVSNYWQEIQSDLFAVFIKKCCRWTMKNGYTAMMTPFVWMFIRSYEKLRRFLIDQRAISSLIQLQYSAFKEATVPVCTFVIHNQTASTHGTYIRLSDFKGTEAQPLKVLEAAKDPTREYRYTADSKNFKKIPGSPIAYWVPDEVRDVFRRARPLADLSPPRQGLATGDNRRFLRCWWEVDRKQIGFHCTSSEEAGGSGLKWFPYNKGGAYRKWYGNNYHVINWQNDGEAVKAFQRSVIRNASFYFKPGITWSFVSSAKFAARATNAGFLFDVGGSSIFPAKEDLPFILAFLNSKLAAEFLKVLNPTLNFQVGNIASLPMIIPADKKKRQKIRQLVEENITIAKTDWDFFETSWDFREHPFLTYRDGTCLIEEAFNNWGNFTRKHFERLRENEEELNRILIEIYDLKGVLTPAVPDEDITVRRADKVQDTKSFISYAVGCMFGRYSPGVKGFVHAGGARDESKYRVFPEPKNNTIALVPEGFQGKGIVSLFIDFVKTTFGEQALQENLAFIVRSLGQREGEPPTECINRYFTTAFYKDHLAAYKKHPVYLLKKEDGITNLIYQPGFRHWAE